MSKFYHPYHLVTCSPWPLMCSLTFIILFFGLLKWLILMNNNLMILGNLLMILNFIQWWRDVVRESTFQGNHTMIVMSGLRIGMSMFILSEVMFFISFFWSYFYMFLSPSVEIGSYWPPLGIKVFNPYNIPLLNTLILLSSGVFITYCHYMMLNGLYFKSLLSLYITLFLGILFILFQYYEYIESKFTLVDSVYGSVFFLMTGFHGLHVIIGVLFIFVSFFRLYYNHYSWNHHFGFEASSWYWHFVDVVWLFLYMFIYWLPY